VWVVVLLGAAICAAYTAVVAGAKGHNEVSWGLGGLFFGPFALIAAAGLPDLKARQYLRASSGTQDEPSKTPSKPGTSGPGFWDYAGYKGRY